MRSARRRVLGEKKRSSRKKRMPDLEKSAAIPAALKAAKYLLPRLRLEHLRAEGRVSAPDAAGTALICGCARALEGALDGAAPGRVRFSLEPDFSAGRSDVLLQGMLSLRAGHIILAALIGAWNYMIRRIPHGKASD